MALYTLKFDISGVFGGAIPKLSVIYGGTKIGMSYAYAGSSTMSFQIDTDNQPFDHTLMRFYFVKSSGTTGDEIQLSNIQLDGNVIDTNSFTTTTGGSVSGGTVSLSKGGYSDYDAATDLPDTQIGAPGADAPLATITGTTGDDIKLYGTNEAGGDVIDALAGNDYVIAGAGDDVVYGRAGNDIIKGGTGNDILNGEDGADRLYGGTGNDTLNGGIGNDRLYGQNGDDTINGGDGVDRIYGGSGNDTLSGGLGNDIIGGNAGNDIINGDAGNDRLYGNAGVDTVRGGDGNDQIRGGDGNDFLYGDAGDDNMDGQNGNDRLEGGAGNDVMGGDDGNDTLLGDDGNDTVYGGQGADVLRGGNGDDILHGGGIDSYDQYTIRLASTGGLSSVYFLESTQSFYQFVLGNVNFTQASLASQASLLNGAAGHLVTIGSQVENDFITNIISDNSWTSAQDVTHSGTWKWSGGIEDNSQFSNSAGVSVNNAYENWDAGQPQLNTEYNAVIQTTGFWNDLADTTLNSYVIEWDASDVMADNSNDFLYGDAGDDQLYGGAGNDRLEGGADNDILYGQDGADTLLGDDGIDTLYGGAGNDKTYGGNGNDIIFDSLGTNTLNGDAGNDILDARWTSSIPSLQAQANEIIANSGLAGLTWSPDTLNFYQFISVPEFWATANTNATGSILEGVAGHLSVVTSVEENNFLISIANQTDQWLGADDSGVEGDWFWNTGPESGQQFWTGGAGGSVVGGMYNSWKLPKEPGNSTAKNYALLKKDGTWKDEDGVGKTKEYSIEWESDTMLVLPPQPPAQGNNTLNGGTGNDFLYGGTGNDILNGDADDDTLYAGDGNDTLNGGTGIDILYGEDGNDIFSGGSGNDTLYGGNGDDIMSGDDGNDVIYGDIGADTLNGGAGNDTLYALDNGVVTITADDFVVNTLNGDAGNDILNGSTGADILNGGAGDDIINSGSIAAFTIAEIESIYGVTYEASTGNFYKLGSGSVNWNTANTESQADIVNGISGHLVTITSVAENNFIDSNFAVGIDIWLAASDDSAYSPQEGDWYWTAGPESGQQFWQGGPENNGGSSVGGFYEDWNAGNGKEPGIDPAKNYAIMKKDGGGWKDQAAGKFDEYVTEWEGSDVLRPGNITILNGQDGLDTLNGAAGTDHFVFEVASAFNDIDIINNFDTAQSDALDLSDLLSGYNPLTDLITNFVEITDSGANSIVKVDVTGSGNFTASTQISTIVGITGLTDEQALETNGNIIA